MLFPRSVLVGLLTGLFLTAQPPPASGAPLDQRNLRPQQAAVSPDASGEKRVALVIGNGAYATSPLKNPVNDARSMTATLRRCDFTVIALGNALKRVLSSVCRTSNNQQIPWNSSGVEGDSPLELCTHSPV